jgi:hypothetical protein
MFSITLVIEDLIKMTFSYHFSYDFLSIDYSITWQQRAKKYRINNQRK